MRERPHEDGYDFGWRQVLRREGLTDGCVRVFSSNGRKSVGIRIRSSKFRQVYRDIEIETKNTTFADGSSLCIVV